MARDVDARVDGRRTAPGTVAGRLRDLRLVLAALGVAVFVTAVLVSQRPTPLSDLYAAASRGELTGVVVEGGLEPGSVGSARQQVRWGDGLVDRVTTVTTVSPGTSSVVGDSGEEVIRTDVGDELQLRDPDLQVQRSEGPTGTTTNTLFGLRVPGWLSLVAAAHWLVTLAVLVQGPQPWRATRWAWFWLMAAPVGTTLFLLLSGPTPGLRRPRRPTHRLTGGKAFLLAALLSAVLPAPWWH